MLFPLSKKESELPHNVLSYLPYTILQLMENTYIKMKKVIKDFHTNHTRLFLLDIAGKKKCLPPQKKQSQYRERIIVQKLGRNCNQTESLYPPCNCYRFDILLEPMAFLRSDCHWYTLNWPFPSVTLGSWQGNCTRCIVIQCVLFFTKQQNFALDQIQNLQTTN